MTAATLNKQQLKKSLNAKKAKNKPPATKAVLCSPYVTKWPSVESDVQRNILNKLKQCFEKNLSLEQETDQQLSVKNENMLKANSTLRKRLVCGVNRVTRCLERDELQLVIVDRSSPWQLHQHLAQLSAVRECKAVAVDNLSTVLSPLLSITRLCAVGFKNQSCEADGDQFRFVTVVEEISGLCPTLELPWLECDTYLRTLKADRLQQNSKQSAVVDCGEVVGRDDHDVIMAEVRAPPDYSHLYIYKQKPVVDSSQQSSDFIMLPASSSDEDYSEDEYRSVGKTRTRSDLPSKNALSRQKDISTKREMNYQTANVGLQQSNAAKKRRKKNKLNAV